MGNGGAVQRGAEAQPRRAPPPPAMSMMKPEAYSVIPEYEYPNRPSSFLHGPSEPCVSASSSSADARRVSEPSAPASSASPSDHTQRIECGRCTLISTVPFGCERFVCSSCGATVRVQLPVSSRNVRRQVQERGKEAEGQLLAILSEQETVTWQAWQGVADALVLEESIWNTQDADSGDTEMYEFLREALAAGDVRRLASLLALPSAQHLPFMSSAVMVDAMGRARREEDLEVVWRYFLQALREQDRTELEFWQAESVAQGLEVPGSIQALVAAIQAEECARLAEYSTMTKVQAQIDEVLNSGNSLYAIQSSLHRIAKDLQALGMDPSPAEAALAALHVNQNPPSSHRQTDDADEDTTRSSHVRHVRPDGSKQRSSHGSDAGTKPDSRSNVSAEGVEDATAGACGRQNIGPDPATDRTTSYSSPHSARDGKEHDPLMGESITKLKAELSSLGFQCDGICEKAELVRLLHIARQKQTASDKAPGQSSGGGSARGAPKSDTGRNAAREQVPPGPREKPRAPAAKLVSRQQALTRLGLSGDATADEVRRAYKQAALKWHPDRRHNHGREEEAKQRFQEAREAFDFLQST